MLPENSCFFISPPDPRYSFHVESDSTATPFVDRDEHDDYSSLDQCSLKARLTGDNLVSSNLQECEDSRRSSPAMQPHSTSRAETISTEADPFSTSFSAGFCKKRYLTAPSAISAPKYSLPSAFVTSHDHAPASPSPSQKMPLSRAPYKFRSVFNREARLHCLRFPYGHRLNPHFVRIYALGDELGSGGFGFVMTAHHRAEGHEVAVKFIDKSKVPEHAWMEDETFGRLPTEVLLLSLLDHDNIVKCLDLFEDALYFYLVQELHGSPWQRIDRRPRKQTTALSPSSSESSLPSLSPSPSESSVVESEPATSPHQSVYDSPYSQPSVHEAPNQLHHAIIPNQEHTAEVEAIPSYHKSGRTLRPSVRPDFSRRPSHDLFECIEQSEHKRLSENQARYVFAQIVEAVYYLDSQGISHRDIKDENILIDKYFKVKLIDFGSAIVVNPEKPRPYYNLFFGTTAYASSEILLKQSYQAAPAEVWTLGVLLSYLLTGASPFPTEKDAIEGAIILADSTAGRLSCTASDLLRKCLEPNPQKRATIDDVRTHSWLTSVTN